MQWYIATMRRLEIRIIMFGEITELSITASNGDIIRRTADLMRIVISSCLNFSKANHCCITESWNKFGHLNVSRSTWATSFEVKENGKVEDEQQEK